MVWCGYLDVVDPAGLGEGLREFCGGHGVGEVSDEEAAGLLARRRPASWRIITARRLDLGCILLFFFYVLLFLFVGVFLTVGREFLSGGGGGWKKNGVVTTGGEEVEADAVVLEPLQTKVRRREGETFRYAGAGVEEGAEGCSGNGGRGHSQGGGSSDEVGAVMRVWQWRLAAANFLSASYWASFKRDPLIGPARSGPRFFSVLETREE